MALSLHQLHFPFSSSSYGSHFHPHFSVPNIYEITPVFRILYPALANRTLFLDKYYVRELSGRVTPATYNY